MSDKRDPLRKVVNVTNPTFVGDVSFTMNKGMFGNFDSWLKEIWKLMVEVFTFETRLVDVFCCYPP